MRYRSGWGWLAVAPAFVALLLSYVWPSVWTLISSFQRKDGINPARWVGGHNYSLVFPDFLRSLGFSLSLTVFALLGVLIVAPLLALAADAAGRRVRLGLRAALALPMLWVAPAALGVSWVLWAVRHGTPSPEMLTRLVIWAGTFGVATGAAATLYLSALRRRADGRRDWWAMPLVGVLGVLTVLALAPQAFTFPLVAGVGSRNRTPTPIGLINDYAFRSLRFGPGAAVGVLLLIVLAVLGLAATAVIVFGRLRVHYEPAPATARPVTPPPGPSPQPSAQGTGLVGVVGSAIGLLLVLAVAWYGLSPWLHAMATPRNLIAEDVFSRAGIRAEVNTCLPTLITAIVSVAVAALGGFGIGWLRPLGRRSELLLLPFGIWLFVGLAPLTEAQYAIHRDLHLINTFVGLIPPVLVSIPVLFICTLFFRGQRMRSGEVGGSAAAQPLLPALPLIGLAFLATWIGYANSAVWPYVAATDSDVFTAPLQVLVEGGALVRENRVALASPPLLVLLIAIGLALAQIFYLDRLSLRAGPEPAVAPSMPGPPSWAPAPHQVPPGVLPSAAVPPGAAPAGPPVHVWPPDASLPPQPGAPASGPPASGPPASGAPASGPPAYGPPSGAPPAGGYPWAAPPPAAPSQPAPSPQPAPPPAAAPSPQPAPPSPPAGNPWASPPPPRDGEQPPDTP